MRQKKVIALATILSLAILTAFPPLAVQTQAAPMQAPTSMENTPVWRVQVRIDTADVWGGGGLGGGGTNDWVDVRLNANNVTRLYSSYSGGDFDRGDSYGYDLILDNVRQLRDITMLQIYKPGGDYWCIESITLSVNGRVVYSVQSPGIWVGPNGYHTIPSPSLRTHSLWRSYTVPSAPQLISAAELMHRSESIIGDFIAGPTLRSGFLRPPLFWRPPTNGYAIQLTGSGPRTIRVDLDLVYYTNVPWEVDIEFDLEFQCAGGALFVMTRNLDMRGYPVIDNLTNENKAIFQAFLLTALPIKMQSALQSIIYRNELGQPACPPVRVVGNSVYLF